MSRRALASEPGCGAPLGPSTGDGLLGEPTCSRPVRGGPCPAEAAGDFLQIGVAVADGNTQPQRAAFDVDRGRRKPAASEAIDDSGRPRSDMVVVVSAGLQPAGELFGTSWRTDVKA